MRLVAWLEKLCISLFPMKALDRNGADTVISNDINAL